MSEHPPIPCPDCTKPLADMRDGSFACSSCGSNFTHPWGLSPWQWTVLWREWTRGMAVVPLPEPDRDGRVWIVEDGERIQAFADADGPLVAVELGATNAWISAHVLRERALAELAAADRAEQLAADAKAGQS